MCSHTPTKPEFTIPGRSVNSARVTVRRLMGYCHFQVSDRVCTKEPVFLYKWMEGELHQYFNQGPHRGQKVPPGLIARLVGPSIQQHTDWMTFELEVESSTHPGILPGDRFIVQNLDSTRWSKIDSVFP